MTFTSLTYLLFFPTILVLFSVVPLKLRWLVLLAASYIFYASFKVPLLLFILFSVTAITYICGIFIHRSGNPVSKKLWLWLGISSNILILFWMKYIPFIIDNLNLLFKAFSIGNIAPVSTYVAIGASYYVFQGISYITDVYLEILEPEPHPGYFALFMVFFPKLLQGPIERGEVLLPQIRALSVVTWENLRVGMRFFIWGMFKKVVIADRLAALVDPVYSNVHGYFGLSLVIATYLFALQIYFDFSGYTDMAIGVARCFNIRLTQNFNAPYLAQSIADFWRRWHISFSSWILDYIFKPLQLHFRDWRRWGTPLALMLTFLVSGFWHGASWDYIAWGGIHGVYLAGNVLMSKSKRKLYKTIGIEKSRLLSMWQVFVTFHLVCFSWIFFRAANIQDAFYVSENAISDIPRSISLLYANDGLWLKHILLGRSPKEFFGVLLLLLLVAGMGLLSRRMAGNDSTSEIFPWLDRCPAWMHGAIYGCMFYLIAFCGASTQSFIYLQF